MTDPATIANRMIRPEENRASAPLRGGLRPSGEFTRETDSKAGKAFAMRRERAFRAEPGIRNYETREQFPK